MILTSTLQNQYQRYFSKKFLEHQVYTLQLDQFAMKQELPKEAGARFISFFRPQRANLADVQQLAEGVPITVFKDQNYVRVDFELIQYGEASRFADILTATQLLDNMKTMHVTMAEDAALKLDSLIRDALVNPATQTVNGLSQPVGLTQRYVAGIANFATLGTTTNTNGSLTGLDLMDSVTQLRNQLAPTISGWYHTVIPPAPLRDIINDKNGWLLAHQYGNDYADLKKGEIGTYAGTRCIWTNNPFVETANTGIGVNVGNTLPDLVGLGTTTATAPIYSVFVVGRDAFGVPALSGDKPKSPSIIIVDEPDSANPLNQFITIGWKTFYAVGVLNPAFGVVLRCKSAFNGSTF